MGNGALAIGPKLPRPSSTLPQQTLRAVLCTVFITFDYMHYAATSPLPRTMSECFQWRYLFVASVD